MNVAAMPTLNTANGGHKPAQMQIEYEERKWCDAKDYIEGGKGKCRSYTAGSCKWTGCCTINCSQLGERNYHAEIIILCEAVPALQYADG